MPRPGISILARETSHGAHWNAGGWIRRGALDIMRTSTHYRAGLTGGARIGCLAESYGMYAEVTAEASCRIAFGDGVVHVPEGTTGLEQDLDIPCIESHSLETVRLPE